MTPGRTLQPLASGQRIEAMDVLRGFALLGILLMNIEAFVGPLEQAMSGLDPALTGADRVADLAVYFFVQGKFWTLFSLLFGMGFVVMQQRAQSAGRPFLALYLRRTLGLLIIGLAHALLVWSGDILVSYALTALVLLLFFRNTPVDRLPGRGVCLYLAPLVLLLAAGLAGEWQPAAPGAAANGSQAVAPAAPVDTVAQAQRVAYGQGDFAAATRQRWEDLKGMPGYIFFLLPMALGLFVLGGWFVRSGMIANPGHHPEAYRLLRRVVLPVGMLAMAGSIWLTPTLAIGEFSGREGVAMALGESGSLLMCLGYLGWVMAGLQSSTWAPWLALLAPAGRMALSNYLLQSLVCTSIFYGYGLGAFEQLPRLWQLPFAVGLFVLQVLASRWWLARFRFGPVEWLWRAWTYLQWPPMRVRHLQ